MPTAMRLQRRLNAIGTQYGVKALIRRGGLGFQGLRPPRTGVALP